jgi:hypothetical protein
VTNMEYNLHNIYRFLAGRKITQIMTSNTTNILHKRKMHVAKQTRNKLMEHNLMIAKADKGKTNIMDKTLYRHKVLDFLQDIHYIKLQKVPTDLP